jgi:peptide/nickel transport system ATP-binding protein
MTETARTETVLRIEGLSISLPESADRPLAVSDAGFTVGAGEIVCVVGESGSGKSLTGAAVMGLLPRGISLVAGTILVGGVDVASLHDRELRAMRGDRVAMIFQEPMTALNPVMTIGDQVAEVFKIHRPAMLASEVRESVLTLLRDVGLPRPEGMRSVYPHQLSGGQRQRVVIAMALALDPALVIADEPTTALDVTTQAQILKLFRELLARRAGGILLITHDFGVVAEVADKVVVMRNGRIVETGPASEVLNSPRHDYTKRLIDAVPDWRFRQIQPQVDPVITVLNLRLSYRSSNFMGRRSEVRAVDDVSLEVRRGETLGIVGESGSGKSSLARALVGLERPQSGSIVMDGREVGNLSGWELRAHRRRTQMIFQDPYRSMNPRQKMANMLTEGPIYHGVEREAALARARDLIHAVGMSDDALQRYPHEFSGGQRQRLCIARALAMDPDVIVADEVVSALDVSVQAQVLELFEKLRAEIGFSMVFVTHDLRVAANICDRIAVMQEGRLVEIGEARQVIQSPASDYARRLVASVPGGIRGA